MGNKSKESWQWDRIPHKGETPKVAADFAEATFRYSQKQRTNDIASFGLPPLLEIVGGRDRDRTCDPYHVKVVLYR